MPNPRTSCSVAIVATSSSSSSSSASTSPCYLKTLGRGRFLQSQRTQAFNRNVGSGRGSIARLLQEHSSSKASPSSASSSLAFSSASSSSSTSITKSKLNLLIRPFQQLHIGSRDRLFCKPLKRVVADLSRRLKGI
jgi:hypothetical protein